MPEITKEITIFWVSGWAIEWMNTVYLYKAASEWTSE
jgi:hypothetical protein